MTDEQKQAAETTREVVIMMVSDLADFLRGDRDFDDREAQMVADINTRLCEGLGIEVTEL